MEDTQINFDGDWENSLSQILKSSFDSPNENLPESIYKMEGMSGKKYRTFVNTLIKNLKDVRYLEVGSWKGSTACASFYNNSGTFTCIDNWSEFGGPKQEFEENTKKHITENVKFNFIENDFRNINYNELGKFNVYVYDGPHSQQDHDDAMSLPLTALDNEYILIVDDWNWDYVRNGTLSGLESSNQKIISSITIRSSLDNIHPVLHGKDSDWHNGYFLAVIQKN